MNVISSPFILMPLVFLQFLQIIMYENVKLNVLELL